MLSLVGTTNIFDVLVQNWSRIFPDNSPLSKHPKNSPYQTRKVNLDHNASFFAYHNQHVVIAISEHLIFLKNVYYDSNERRN